MKTYKKATITLFIILSLFTIISGVSANDSNNANSTITETNHEKISLSDNHLNDKSTIKTNHNFNKNEKTNNDDSKSENNDEQLSYTHTITDKQNSEINTEKLGDSSTIYVAPNEDSEYGEGSETKPFASINKAVTQAKTGSGRIIIKEGNYHENGIIIDGNKPISIIGEGQVVIDNTGLAEKSIFTIETKEVIIKNIKFTNNKGNYGSAFKIIGGSTSNLEINVHIYNCCFENLEANRGGGIYTQYTKGNLSINNCNFTKINSSLWGGAICAHSCEKEGGLNLKINNSNFLNNYASLGGAIQLTKILNVTITNTNFYNNSANEDAVIQLNKGNLNLDKCTIYNNSVLTNKPIISLKGSQEFGEIDTPLEGVSIVVNSNATITNCIIENNFAKENKVPAIHLENTNLNISYSSIVNEFNIENTVNANYNFDKPGLLTANNNWWGTDDPFTKINGTNIQIENWITMNIKTNASILESGDIVNVSVDFNHLKTKTGEIKDFTGWTIPKIYNINFKTDSGLVNLENLKMRYGELKNIIYTANVVPDTLSVNCDGFVSNIKFKDNSEPYFGVIYVSKEGNDLNDGSFEYPVASIVKAIELASLEEASGEIIINSGTYNGFNYEINKNLSITGYDTVILDGEGLGCIFKASSDVNRLSLSNLILKNGRYDYGASVRSYASKTLLNNITIIGLNDVTGILILANYDLSINNSKISNHNGGDLIKSSGNIIINNSLFEDNIVNSDNSDFGIIYLSSSSDRTLIVENSRFINNTARQGVIHGSSKTKINIKDSTFINNTNLISNGGAIYADQNSELDVNNSTFINNHAINNVGRNGGAISILANSKARISKSVFINNSASGDGDAIYNKGDLIINYSVLLTNNSHKLIFNEKTTNAQFNWWGINDNPKNLVSNNVDNSNWVIMNIDIPDEVNNIAQISVDFKHYQTSTNIKELNENIPELTVMIGVVNGSVDKKILNTTNNIAKVTYTVLKEGYDTVTFSSNDAIISKFIKTIQKQDISATVTPNNINFYFDNNGYLNPSITSKELVFMGEFNNLEFKINRPINITGCDALFNNTNVIICADNVNLTNITFICDKIFDDTYCVIYIEADNVLIKNNTITYNAPNGESYVIYAETINGLEISDNIINYIGSLYEYTSTITIYITDCENIKIKNNNINSNIPSIPLEELIRTAGLLIEDSLKINLESNNISVNYNSFEGDKDTLYAVDLSYSNNLTINKNNIQINGHDYSYGLILIECNDSIISMNNICANSLFSQANGLDISNYKDIDGLRKYNIENNNITSSAQIVVYPINFSDIKQKSDANITSNNIKGESKFVYGLFIQGHKLIIQNNNIISNGNYTTGIISHLTDLTITNNTIKSNASNIGDTIGKHPSEVVKAETNSLLLSNGKIEIRNNILTSSGDYTINLINCNGIIKNNNLSLNKGITGDITIKTSEDSVVEIDNNKTSLINSTGHNNTEDNSTLSNNNETDNNRTNNTTNTNESGSTGETIVKQELNKNQSKISTKTQNENNISANQVSLTNIKTPKSISKKAKKLVITVKLKIKGKIAKHKTVLFIFNGGKYKVKTNNKGIAKLILKKTKLKKLLKKVKVGKKLKYKIKYGKKIVKEILKVKK